jgi:hypothetical protein
VHGACPRFSSWTITCVAAPPALTASQKTNLDILRLYSRWRGHAHEVAVNGAQAVALFLREACRALQPLIRGKLMEHQAGPSEIVLVEYVASPESDHNVDRELRSGLFIDYDAGDACAVGPGHTLAIGGYCKGRCELASKSVHWQGRARWHAVTMIMQCWTPRCGGCGCGGLDSFSTGNHRQAHLPNVQLHFWVRIYYVRQRRHWCS